MLGELTGGRVRSIQDLGGQDAIVCNITFDFDMGWSGLAPWDQYTWGCRRRIPPVPGGTRQSSAASGGVAFARTRNPARKLLATRRTCQPGSHTIYETTRDGQEANAVEFARDDPKWECVAAKGFCCDECPVGKYQHMEGSSSEAFNAFLHIA